MPVYAWGVPEFIAKDERRFLVGRTVGNHGPLNGVTKGKCQLVVKCSRIHVKDEKKQFQRNVNNFKVVKSWTKKEMSVPDYSSHGIKSDLRLMVENHGHKEDLEVQPKTVSQCCNCQR